MEGALVLDEGRVGAKVQARRKVWNTISRKPI